MDENKVQIFNFKNDEIRTIEINGGIWFVGNDICKALDIKLPHSSLKLLQRDDLHTMKVIDSLGRNQKTTVINESGLYSLVLKSRKPEAEKFKKWITSDVLPTIRKTGRYEFNSPQSEDELILRSFTILRTRLEQQKPKVDIYDRFISSKGSYLIREAAKILQENHEISMGEQNLYEWLRSNNYLMSNNEPYQNQMKYFEVKARTYTNKKDGSLNLTKTTCIKPQGIIHIAHKLETESNVKPRMLTQDSSIQIRLGDV